MPQLTPGSPRCPACGQKALPMQTHCLYCNARIRDGSPKGTAPAYAIQADMPLAPPVIDGKCPGCAKEMPTEAVLCVECGYDRRTGQKRATLRGAAEDSEADGPRRKRGRHGEPLPAGLSKVRLGLAFHYAQLILMLLGIPVVSGMVIFIATAHPKEDDPVPLFGGLAALGIVVVAGVLGLAGSVLCLWVNRASRAWGFIFVSLLLDLATPPLIVYMQFTHLPPVIAWVVEFVSWIFFMMFLRRLAFYVDRSDEANEIAALITRGVALLVGVPLFLVLLAMMTFLAALSSNAAVTLFLMVSTLILGLQLIFLIQMLFAILGNIQTLRAAIASRLPSDEWKEANLPIPAE